MSATSSSGFAGKTAVVTGASFGIGRATAMELAKRGARVGLVARSEEALLETAAAIRHLRPGAAWGGDPGAVVIPADVTDPDAVTRMAERARAELGDVDILVNNAGISRWGPFAETELEDARAVLDVNVAGVLLCTKAFLPRMIERGAGTIVMVSSGLGQISFPGASIYCASKHAVNGFANALRAEVEPLGVRVLLATPGLTRTHLGETLPPRPIRRYLFQTTQSPEEVAARTVRAIERGKRREPYRLLNEVGLRFASAFPGIRDAYIGWVGRRLRREFGWGTGAHPNDRAPAADRN